MVSILDPRTNETLTANSLSSLLHKIMNDEKSRSVPTNQALLVKQGFDLATLTDDGKHTRSNRQPKAPQVDPSLQVFNMIKGIVSQVDSAKIKEIKDEISRIATEEDVMDLKVGKRIKELKNKLVSLNNPVFTRDSMLLEATAIIDKYFIEPTEPTESSK